MFFCVEGDPHTTETPYSEQSWNKLVRKNQENQAKTTTIPTNPITTIFSKQNNQKNRTKTTRTPPLYIKNKNPGDSDFIHTTLRVKGVQTPKLATQKTLQNNNPKHKKKYNNTKTHITKNIQKNTTKAQKNNQTKTYNKKHTKNHI
ncbi:hypothetical protein AMET1_1361 [Methanonatronarchaeum thermophilum]|uniref:Uncharacterized protein n=1 Tax=Methanonatronarchaeum thermophilum TaxID=1927129 RepID=A0A1Y3GG60_9EURY|nr:hypothetical protein AMET1_1361 [Methanonatronarchaeum thermophilum]